MTLYLLDQIIIVIRQGLCGSSCKLSFMPVHRGKRHVRNKGQQSCAVSFANLNKAICQVKEKSNWIQN
jgi:hypothetical protein